MYRSLSVNGLRGLRDLSIERFARINLITGKNASGKTTLLEALALHAMPFDYNGVMQLDASRIGRPDVAPMMVGMGFQSSTETRLPWRRLFGAKDEIRIAGIYGERKWSVLLGKQVGEPSALAASTPSSQSSAQPVTVIASIGELSIFCRDDEKRRDYIGTITAFQGGGWRAHSPSFVDAPFVNRVRMTTGVVDTTQLAVLYSAQVGTSLENEILEVVKMVVPEVKRLVVVAEGANAVSSLCADIGTGNPIELGLVSDGLVHIAGIALAVSQAKNGICLLDEFENGLHVSVLSEIWQAIYAMCLRLNVQLFVTTHSDECARAAFSSIPRGELLIHRLGKKGDQTHVQTMDHEVMEAAFSVGLEVR